MAGYDDYQTEEEYIAAAKKRWEREMDTKELVARLRRGCNCRLCKMDRCCCAEMEDAADTIEHLERERDTLAKAYDSEKEAAAQYREFAAAKSREKVDEFRRAEAALVELSALRARVARLAKMEDALRAIDAKVVELGLAAQRKANGHKHEKFAAVRHSMRLIVSAALTEEQP